MRRTHDSRPREAPPGSKARAYFLSPRPTSPKSREIRLPDTDVIHVPRQVNVESALLTIGRAMAPSPLAPLPKIPRTSYSRREGRRKAASKRASHWFSFFQAGLLRQKGLTRSLTLLRPTSSGPRYPLNSSTNDPRTSSGGRRELFASRNFVIAKLLFATAPSPSLFSRQISMLQQQQQPPADNLRALSLSLSHTHTLSLYASLVVSAQTSGENRRSDRQTAAT